MATCFIGLGSNLGSSDNTLKSALADLKSHSNITLIQSSRLYGSKPHGPQDQPDYLNAVAEIDTSLSPHDLLDVLQSIETSHNRIRTGQHWGPRTLDLDLLLYGKSVIKTDRLTVPHAYMTERNFVLYPLAEIKNDLIFPNGSALSDYLVTSTDDHDAVEQNEAKTNTKTKANPKVKRVSTDGLWIFEDLRH